MKSIKLLSLALTLNLFCDMANAEWTLVTENQSLDLFYLDWASLKKIDKNRKIWMIQDHKNANKNGVVSNLSLTEFNCAGQVRYITIIAYPEHMGNGKPLGIANSVEWMEFPPGTTIDGVSRLVCPKK